MTTSLDRIYLGFCQLSADFRPTASIDPAISPFRNRVFLLQILSALIAFTTLIIFRLHSPVVVLIASSNPTLQEFESSSSEYPSYRCSCENYSALARNFAASSINALIAEMESRKATLCPSYKTLTNDTWENTVNYYFCRTYFTTAQQSVINFGIYSNSCLKRREFISEALDKNAAEVRTLSTYLIDAIESTVLVMPPLTNTTPLHAQISIPPELDFLEDRLQNLSLALSRLQFSSVNATIYGSYAAYFENCNPQLCTYTRPESLLQSVLGVLAIVSALNMGTFVILRSIYHTFGWQGPGKEVHHPQVKPMTTSRSEIEIPEIPKSPQNKIQLIQFSREQQSDSDSSDNESNNYEKNPKAALKSTRQMTSMG